MHIYCICQCEWRWIIHSSKTVSVVSELLKAQENTVIYSERLAECSEQWEKVLDQLKRICQCLHNSFVNGGRYLGLCVRSCGIEVLFVLIEAPPTMHQCGGEHLVWGLWGTRTIRDSNALRFVLLYGDPLCASASLLALLSSFFVRSVKSVSCWAACVISNRTFAARNTRQVIFILHTFTCWYNA